MQYHVPAGLVSSSPVSAALAHPSGGSGNTPASLFSPHSVDVAAVSVTAPTPHQPGAPTGVAVGLGLLSGRRLAVRVAPPTASTSNPRVSASNEFAQQPAVLHPTDRMSDAANQLQSDFSSLTQPLRASPLSTTAPPQTSPSPTSYGGGIVRISDLRRQGVQVVESGLRLATLQGSRFTPGQTTPSRRGEHCVNDGNALLADAFVHSHSTGGGAATRTTTSRGRRPRAPSSPSSNTTRNGRRASRADSGGRRSSRELIEVPLTETGELCDYRWFTARGRRCFVYDGRTYKGSTAHRMWAKVKEMTSRRGRRGLVSQRQQQEQQPQTSHVSAGDATHTTAARRAVPHRTSARARAAARRSLDIYSNRSVEPLKANLPLPRGDEWRALMRELSVEGADETALPESSCTSSPHCGPPSHTPTPAIERPSQQLSREVVEITDSSSTEDSFSSSDTDEGPPSKATAEALGTGLHRGFQTPPPLHWPKTSYFSDESSGWSSTSSPAAPRSPVLRCMPPSCKRVKTEPPTSQQTRQPLHDCPSHPSASAPRVQLYNGVKVVEEGGWVYPLEVYTAQQRHDRAEQQGRRRPPTAAAEAFLRASSNLPAEAVEEQLTAFGLEVLQDVSDVPFSKLFTEVTTFSDTTAGGGGMTRGHDEALLLHGTLPHPAVASSHHHPPGISVVVGSNANVMPLRPAMAVGTEAGKRGIAMTTLAAQGVSAAVLRDVDDGDPLGAFPDTELADMFVTGEEVGGVRFGS
jgi:hypothetical protein